MNVKKKDNFKSAFISVILITQMHMGWFVQLKAIIEIKGQQQQ